MLLLLLVLGWTLFPLWWAVALSLKQPQDFFTAKTLPFLQFQPTLANWRGEWQAFWDPAGLGHGLVNSLGVALLVSGLSLLLGGLAAFGLRLQRRSRRRLWPWLAWLLWPRIVPPVVMVIPFSLLIRSLHIEDSLTALVLSYTGFTLPLAALLLFSVMLEVPNDLLDAALVEGCDWFTAFWLVVTPLCAPMYLAAGALCFAQSWNEFLFAVTNVQQHAQTAPLAVASLLNKDGVEFAYVGSHLLLVMAPPILLALLARRLIVRGLALGMVK